MTADVDAIVIGAGVIGLAVARQFAGSGKSVLVLESSATAGTETSARNSEVIHAGLYYAPNSLKARLCREGHDLLYAFCAASGVAARRVGKLIVATSPEEVAKLTALRAQAMANGVHDLTWLEPGEVQVMEPEIHSLGAIYSPSTGIIDAAGFTLALRAEAESHGTTFAFNTTFEAATRRENVFHVRARGREGEVTDITSTLLINCAGHGAHQAARAISGVAAASLPPRYLAKGCYCSVSGAPPFRHLVYPVPVAGGLGVHATCDMTGAIRFGPDVHWVDNVDYTLPPGLPERFMPAIAHYWPHVTTRTLSPSYCGIRPKISGPAEPAADFACHGEAQHGVPGLVSLFGIESPGLTASLAIARHVAGLCGASAAPPRTIERQTA
jgi:L-2-hydroxyglutarate oxidase LhgO